MSITKVVVAIVIGGFILLLMHSYMEQRDCLQATQTVCEGGH